MNDYQFSKLLPYEIMNFFPLVTQPDGRTIPQKIKVTILTVNINLF